METAHRHKTNITVMVWEDHAYGLIKWKQENHFGKHTDLDFGNPDFMKLADAFGWQGIYCDKSSELAAALERSFQTEGPSLVVIPIDYRENNLLTARLGNIACSI
jgi:acetolactate synthase-1/2/3 large subunit